jgi:hypothetical protein
MRCSGAAANSTQQAAAPGTATTIRTDGNISDEFLLT